MPPVVVHCKEIKRKMIFDCESPIAGKNEEIAKWEIISNPKESMFLAVPLDDRSICHLFTVPVVFKRSKYNFI